MNSKNNAKTILIKVIGFLIIGFFFTSNETVSKTLFIICAVISLAELISPTLGSYIVWFWNELAHMPGWINTRILLSIFFMCYYYQLPLFIDSQKKIHFSAKNRGEVYLRSVIICIRKQTWKIFSKIWFSLNMIKLKFES